MVAAGKTVEDLFAHAAEGLACALLDTQDSEGGRVLGKHVELTSPLVEDLFVDWLNELKYLFFSEKFLFRSARSLTVKDGKLTADVEGLIMTDAEAAGAREIKAATYHDVRIRRDGEYYTVEIIFDI